MFNFLYVSVLFSVFFFFLSFLDWDPLKSCLMMCVGIIFMGFYVSLGIHSWYSYFIILVFLSGIFSLLTYFCSLCNYNLYVNYYYVYFFFFFFFVFFFDLDFCFFYFDYNFVCIYYDFNYYYIFWIIFVLLLLLNLISFSFNGGGFMRGL
uniref:NADH dehydrogenase subunit 6 n=1 Tax=Setaria digitata TaxID=48799 RepID=D8WJC9_9BILA|nr:NADH dehydrogenase subunit 6 [Setaria digitata]ACZ44413.1 NADH dehydrogenase subunit 6 [Setaria digitata]